MSLQGHLRYACCGLVYRIAHQDCIGVDGTQGNFGVYSTWRTLCIPGWGFDMRTDEQ